MLLLLNICVKNKIVAIIKSLFNWTKKSVIPLWVIGLPRKHNRHSNQMWRGDQS